MAVITTMVWMPPSGLPMGITLDNLQILRLIQQMLQLRPQGINLLLNNLSRPFYTNNFFRSPAIESGFAVFCGVTQARGAWLADEEREMPDQVGHDGVKKLAPLPLGKGAILYHYVLFTISVGISPRL